MKKISFLKIVVFIGIAFFGVLCWKAVPLKNDNKDYSGLAEQSIFIIGVDEGVEVDKDGNYIYPDLNEKSVVSFQRIIPDVYIDQQQNECVAQLLKNRETTGSYQCFSNGHTYVLLSYGKTTSSVYVDTQPLSVNEDGELVIDYKFVANDLASNTSRAVYYLFQIPTDKTVQFVDNSTLLEGVDVSLSGNEQQGVDLTGGDSLE